jgi:D-lactate dehydrogenase (cytochrome)
MVLERGRTNFAWKAYTAHYFAQTVVLPNGEVIKTRRRARKSSAGWDTTKLFIGAEGTLGIVTEATLRLAPVLPTKVAMAQFPGGPDRAVAAVQEILLSPYGAHIRTFWQ